MSVENILKPNNNDIYCRNLNVDGDTIFNGQTQFNDEVTIAANLRLVDPSRGIQFYLGAGFDYQSYLGYYHQADEPDNFTFSTNEGTPVNNTISDKTYIVRVGNLVCMQLPFFIVPVDANILNDYSQITVGIIDAQFRPVNNNVLYHTYLENTSVSYLCRVTITTSGFILIARTSGNFSRLANTLFFNQTFTWVIAN